MAKTVYRCDTCNEPVIADRYGSVDYMFCDSCSAYVGYWADEQPVKLVHHTGTWIQMHKLLEGE
jgi:hypothetical protein